MTDRPLRIGYLNRVDYVIAAHVMRLAAPEGLTEEQCRALKEWPKSALFSPQQRTEPSTSSAHA